MNAFRRLAAPLTALGLVALGMFALATSASAQACVWPCGQTNPPIQLLADPDLTVEVTANPNPVARGGTHTYVLRIGNYSWQTFRLFQRQVPGPTVSNVRVHLNSYPSNERLLSYTNNTGSGFTCYTPAEYFGMDVRCIGGTIPSGTTAQITLTMAAPTTAGGFTARASVDPYTEIVEQNEGNNNASVVFSVN
jgi:hypothetical protein